MIINPRPKDSHEAAPRLFTFDAVFDMASKQEQIFKTVAIQIVDSVVEGYNGTIFA